MNPFTNAALRKATADMTPAEAGIYLKLIIHAREKQLWPKSQADIARLTGCSNSHIDRYKTAITKAAEVALLWVPVEWVPVEWVPIEKRENLLQRYKKQVENIENSGGKVRNFPLSSSIYIDIKKDEKRNTQIAESIPVILTPAQLLRQRPSQLESVAMQNGMPPEVIDQEITAWNNHQQGNDIKDSQHALNLWRYWCKSYRTKQHEKSAERRGAEQAGTLVHKGAKPVRPEDVR